MQQPFPDLCGGGNDLGIRIRPDQITVVGEHIRTRPDQTAVVGEHIRTRPDQTAVVGEHIRIRPDQTTVGGGGTIRYSYQT